MANHLMQLDPFSEAARLSPFRGFDDLFKEFRLRPAFGGRLRKRKIKHVKLVAAAVAT